MKRVIYVSGLILLITIVIISGELKQRVSMSVSGITKDSDVPAKTPNPVQGSPTANTKAHPHQIMEFYGQIPLVFEENRGQAQENVDFLARGSGYGLFLTDDAAILSLKSPKEDSGASIVNLRLIGSNSEPSVKGMGKLPSKSNYFIGNDSQEWHTNISHYSKVCYEQIYPGIDLIYYGNQRRVEYDFIVAPGIDPRIICLRFDGTDKVCLDDNGNLSLHTRSGEIILKKPLTYQNINDIRREVQAEYVVMGENRASFAVGEYDMDYPLIIDPIVYSTYLGSSGEDFVGGIAVDKDNNVYISGNSIMTTDFLAGNPSAGPVWEPAGSSDIIIVKLDEYGQLVYFTYFGGSGSEGAENDIAVDGDYNVYIAGHTKSTDLPGDHRGSYYKGNTDAFVAKLNMEATEPEVCYSIYLGGTDLETSRRIAVDDEGNVFVTGYTRSSDFYTTSNEVQGEYNAAQGEYGGGSDYGDAFFTKLNSDGSLVYSTFLGGSSEDYATSIAVDIYGYAYISGSTQSLDFPKVDEPTLQSPLQPFHGGGTWDAFVAKIHPSDSPLVYSTYFGGSGDDWGRVTVDDEGNIYIAGGTTSSNDFPLKNPWQSTFGGSTDAFVAKLNAGGSDLIYSTFLGSSAYDNGTGIAVDDFGNVYVVGYTFSENGFPLLDPIQEEYGGTRDGFIAKLNDTGNVVFSTYFGGSNTEECGDVEVDGAGNACITGVTKSTDFTTVNPVQDHYTGGHDVFVAKISSPPQDNIGPIVYDLVTIPNPVAMNNTVELTATIDDSTTGGSTIDSAEYEIDDSGEWITMDASDGSFDEVAEDVEATISGFSEPGVHKIRVRGTDSVPNLGYGGPVDLVVNSQPIPEPDNYNTDEDAPLAVPAQGVLLNDHDDDNDPLEVQGDYTQPPNGSVELHPDGSFIYTPNGNFNGVDTFQYTITDGIASSEPATVTITVNPVNDAPVAENDTEYSTDEDTPLNVSAPGVLGNDSDVDSESISVGEYDENTTADGTVSINDNGSFTYTPAENFNGNDSFTYKASDGELFSNPATVTITVNPINDSPVVSEITAVPILLPVNDTVSVSASFTDPDAADSHTAVWYWDWSNNQDNKSDGVVQENDSVSGSHIYDTTGVYTIRLKVTDDHDPPASGLSPLYEFIVVYDPNGGFVTGGGWIDSPSGAYTPDNPDDPDLTGKATFGFVSKYKKGATVPTGQTEFQFKVADMNFHSTEYQWLVIAGSKAKYKGDGTINGEGEYGFMLTAIDGDLDGGEEPDKFRIKIWEKATEETVYDNKLGVDDDLYDAQEIGGGSIVIHSDKDPKAAPKALPGDTCLLAAYPNPFNPDVWIPYRLNSDCKVVISIHDISGRLVRTMNLGNQPAGFYVDKSKAAYWDGRNEAGEHVASGLYFYTIQAGQYTATKKMVVNK